MMLDFSDLFSEAVTGPWLIFKDEVSCFSPVDSILNYQAREGHERGGLFFITPAERLNS